VCKADRLNEGSALRDWTSYNRLTGIFLLRLILSHFFASTCAGAVYQSDGSASSVQNLHRRASNGDTIALPAGTFTWSTPVTISKAIKLQGAGSGRIIGNTKSSVSIGTGTKSFETTRVIPGITAGQILRIAKMPNMPRTTHAARENYMEGAVTSYSGTTLVMNIASTGGSGSWHFWWIATKPTTTIVNNYENGSRGNNSAPPMLQIQQSLAGSAEVTGFQFTSSPTSVSSLIGIRTANYITPKALIHGCWFQTGNGGKGAAIFSASNQVVIWNCSFDDTYELSHSEAFQIKAGHGIMDASWSTNSTMGMDDVDGAANFYIEDCDFHAHNQVCDADDNARVVIRHCIWDNSQFANHGADTSAIGVRHIELYDNELIFDVFPGDCATEIPLQHAVWLRGGTAVITDNVFPRITSGCAKTKANIMFSVLNTRRKSGPYCCWTTYPAPHQVGQGYGPGAVFHAFTGCGSYRKADYYIYSEPAYIWNNTGSGGNLVSLNGDPDACGNNQQVADYIQEGRDYKLEPKPGYVKYTYPHPLRSSPSRSQLKSSAAPTSSHHFHLRKERKTKKVKTGWGKAKKNPANDTAAPGQ